MRLNDPFRLNDWKFRDFLVIVLAMQLSLLSAIVLAHLGLDLTIFRQIVGFFYLAFVPGIILLRIFRVHGLSRISTLLYSVGLSIAFLMLFGFSLNTLFPLVGFSNPISSGPMMLAISAAVLTLSILSCVRDRAFSSPSFLDAKEITSPVVLALCLIPVLSVSGTYLMNFLDNNLVLLVLLFVISILPILAMLHRFPEKLYPLTIFVVAISLLYHNSLISTYITGWDVQGEYYYSSLVQTNSYWLSSIPSNANAMLSIVMLAPIFSIVCNLNLVWVFKVFYPAFFALVPLGIYGVLRKYVDDRNAFLSCFFFMSLFTFYNEMPSLARQEIAELFQILLILLMVDRGLNVTKKSIFGVIFAFSLVTSHYGLSYIFMSSLVAVWAIFMLRKWRLDRKGILSSHAFVSLYCIFVLGWYIYVSGSSTFAWALTIGRNIIANIAEFANPRTVQGLNIITSRASSLLYEITKIQYLIVNFLISVGILAVLLRRTKIKFGKEYVLFSGVSFALLLGGITIPYLASSLGTSRLYHVALLFLAPFCVVGGMVVLDKLSRVFGAHVTRRIDFLKVLSVFFAVLFLFSSGFVYEIAKDRSSSISLNGEIDFPRFNEREVVAAEWMGDRANRSIPAYSDLYRSALLDGVFAFSYYLDGYYVENTSLPEIRISLSNVSYFFLGYRNVREGEFMLMTASGGIVTNLQNLTLYNTLMESNQIYDNNGASIYLYPGD